ncbi:MAG: hypothetical protein KA821_14930 [Chitinophagaceae bacterium]|nr:hypothetical protein [Chitinophagaceae bacterium]
MRTVIRVCLLTGLLLSLQLVVLAQPLKTRYNNSTVYAGIEVGSKGVKMSVVEMGRNSQSSGAFQVLKDTSVNTDFISFTSASSEATLNGLTALYTKALDEYKIPSDKIYTVISSGVKMQAEKDNRNDAVSGLIQSFRTRIKEPERQVEVVDVIAEARLSHLGIVPAPRRYTTFLIDIGSGNTKGGYFPNGNTRDFKLFQLNWGTKSVANETEKRCDEFDKTLSNYNKQLGRVLSGVENAELIYAVNASGAYPLSDNIAFSGGIAWAVATLTHPEQASKSSVSVTYEEVKRLSDQLLSNYSSLSDSALARANTQADQDILRSEVQRVHKVFDQRALMAGTGLLLKIMRQFTSIYESKGFQLVKNGQVGWISAYVDQAIQ